MRYRPLSILQNQRAIAICLLMAAAVLMGAPAAHAQSDALIARAYEHAYNLDNAEAVSQLEDAARLQPEIGTIYRALASITWLHLLFERGTVLVDEYLGTVSRSDVKLQPPPPQVSSAFERYLDRAIALAERRVAAHPDEAGAHYQLSSALGLQASYAATVEGRMGRAFSAARRAYKAAERAADLAPSDPQPRLVLGTYRYVVSGLNLPVRMVAYVTGLDGDKEKGLRLVEEAARSTSLVRTEARFALVLLYNREKRWDAALQVLADLRAAYPRNRLLWLETGATALRAARAGDAERWLTEGIGRLATDRRARMFGEEALWHLKRGQARRAQGLLAAAREDLLASLAEERSREWVRGRAHLELSETSLALGDRAQARWQAQKAIISLTRGQDAEGAREARGLLERLGPG